MTAVLLLAMMAAPPTVAFVPPPDSGSWFQARAEAVMAEQLAEVGFWIRPSSALTTPARGDAVVQIRSKPARVDVGSTSVTLRVAVRGAQLRLDRVKGAAVGLERLVAALSREMARALGQPVAPQALEPSGLPFVVHRRLGRAMVRLRRGELRQAMLAFDQVGLHARWAPVPAGVDGRRRAFQRLVHAGAAKAGQRGALAAASVERARVAARRKDVKAVERAWQGFLRYTDDYALRWAMPGALSRHARLYPARGRTVLADRGQRWTFDPRTGVVDEPNKTARALVGVLGEETLHLEERVLVRRTAEGKVRWRLGLPVKPSGPEALFATSGFIGILGVDTVVWADAGLGHLGQVSRLTPPLDASAGGVLVRLPNDGDQHEIGLLRPGKRTPAWRVKLPPVRQARLSRDRVVVVARDGLHLLRTHNGKPARPLRTWPEEARWLHVDGRYGTAVDGAGKVLVVDVLQGRTTGEQVGPSRPIAGMSLTEGVAVLFESGDVFQLDRDGKVVDRARPPGRPRQLMAGHPLAPGPVVVTSHGVFAYAEVRQSTVRDVDAYLALADLAARDGRLAQALRLATAVAVRGAGQVAAAESLRARLLVERGDDRRAAAARRRAELAADPRRPLPWPSVGLTR